jgi:hypothetical protein
MADAFAEAQKLATQTAIESGDGTGNTFLITEIVGGVKVVDGTLHSTEATDHFDGSTFKFSKKNR